MTKKSSFYTHGALDVIEQYFLMCVIIVIH